MTDKIADLRAKRVRESRRFVETDLSTSLLKRVEEFWEHAKDCLEGGGSRRRTMAIIGESGTGKSTAIAHVLNSFEEFKRYKNEYGEEVIPVLSADVDYTFTPKDLAIHLLRKLGQDGDHGSNEASLYEALKDQLRASGTVILHLDEAQHLKKSGTSKAVMGLKERFKSLQVIDGWPLHLMVSGVEDLSELFTGDQQMPNRSNVMRFEVLSSPGDNAVVKKTVADIAAHCELRLDETLITADFLGRLVSATGGGIGTLIEMTRAACFKAMSKGHSSLTSKDFEFVYGRTSGSRPGDNIITAEAWRDIDRNTALADFIPAPATKKRNPKKGAE